MKVHYLEIVAQDIDAICKAYEATHSVQFGSPDEVLGGARTCTLPDGSIIGVRSPLSETEVPIIRPYWLTDNIQQSLENAVAQGAEVAHPPLELVGKGTFAIYIQGGIQHGLWQL